MCSSATQGGQRLQTAPGFSQLQLKRETPQNHRARHHAGVKTSSGSPWGEAAGRELASRANSDHLACLWDLLEMAPLSINFC